MTSGGLYLSGPESGGMGWSPRGKGRGKQRGSGGREVGGKVWRHAESPSTAQGGPSGGHGTRCWGLRKPLGGLGRAGGS